MRCLITAGGLRRRDMTDIKTFIGFFTDDQSKAAEIINFFQDRRWFDDPPEIRDGIPYLSDSQMTVYETKQETSPSMTFTNR